MAIIGSSQKSISIRNSAWLITSVLITLFSFFSLSERAYGPLVPFIKLDLHLTEVQVGLLGGATMVGTLIAMIPFGFFIDRVSSRIGLGISMIGLGLFFFMVGLQKAFIGLFIVLVLLGIFRSGVIPLINKVIAQKINLSYRGTVIGFVYSGPPLGGFLGAIILPFIGQIMGWGKGYYLLAIFCILCGIMCMILLPTDARNSSVSPPFLRRNISFSKLNRILIIASIYCVHVSSMFAIRSFLALYLVDEIKLLAVLAGGYFAISEGSAIFGRIIWGLLSDRLLHQKPGGVLGLNAFVTVIAITLLTFLVNFHPNWFIAIVMIIFGMSVPSSLTITSKLLIDNIGEESTAMGTVLNEGFMAIAAIVGPLIFGFIVQETRAYNISFTFFGVTSIISAILFSFMDKFLAKNQFDLPPKN